jgi:hypothetical protein
LDIGSFFGCLDAGKHLADHFFFSVRLTRSCFFLIDANSSGAAQEVVNGIRKASKAITEQEARQILGVSEKTSWEEILKVCACVTIEADFLFCLSSINCYLFFMIST